MTPDDYTLLRATLDRPPPLVLAEMWLLELLHPHTPPDDPDWPLPAGTAWANYRDLKETLVRMRHAQQVVCALVAVEMVAPLWVQWVARTREPVPLVLSRVMRHARGVMDGGVDWSMPLRESLFRARHLADEEGAHAPAWVASAAAQAYSAANDQLFPASGFRPECRTEAYAAAAIDDAFQAWLQSRQADPHRAAFRDASQTDRDRFFGLWWRRCRARLALADGFRVELA